MEYGLEMLIGFQRVLVCMINLRRLVVLTAVIFLKWNSVLKAKTADKMKQEKEKCSIYDTYIKMLLNRLHSDMDISPEALSFISWTNEERSY